MTLITIGISIFCLGIAGVFIAIAVEHLRESKKIETYLKQQEKDL